MSTRASQHARQAINLVLDRYFFKRKRAGKGREGRDQKSVSHFVYRFPHHIYSTLILCIEIRCISTVIERGELYEMQV